MDTVNKTEVWQFKRSHQYCSFTGYTVMECIYSLSARIFKNDTHTFSVAGFTNGHDVVEFRIWKLVSAYRI